MSWDNRGRMSIRMPAGWQNYAIRLLNANKIYAYEDQ